MDKQEAHKIEQDALNYPQVSTDPVKKKINYWIISTLVLSIILVIVVAFYFFYSSNKSKSEREINSNLDNTSVTKSVIPTLLEEQQSVEKVAFIREDNLWVSYNGKEIQLTTDAKASATSDKPVLQSVWYSNPQISPDGSKVAYLKNRESNTRTLVISDIDGKSVRELTNDVEWAIPLIQWSSDSQEIYYPSTGGVETVLVKSLNVITGQKQELGKFTVGSGCGGGSSDPSDHLAAGENITGIGGGVQVFNISPNNNFVVHTTDCTGNGLEILNLSNKVDKKLDEGATKATISPDGESIAVILGNSIIIYDSTGKKLKNYQTVDIPKALLWDNSGRAIYYSSSVLVKDLNFEEGLAIEIVGSFPVKYRVNLSTLWKLELDKGESEKIIQFDAHSIKPVFVDNQRLLVVMVENPTKLYEYINQYKTRDNLNVYSPKVNLLQVNLTDLNSKLLLKQAQQSSYSPN